MSQLRTSNGDADLMAYALRVPVLNPSASTLQVGVMPLGVANLD
jgi:hypothetical protein